VTGDVDEAQREIERIEALPLENRAPAYLAEQRRLQDRLERTASRSGD
jgi:hypothetical protein